LHTQIKKVLNEFNFILLRGKTKFILLHGKKKELCNLFVNTKAWLFFASHLTIKRKHL